ncbi:MAG: ParB-like nuclease domain-containing protein [Chitinispirillaceae bacterium]|nr:ParB-like nuclease domain-containing protein [Chitinispirillaceae bacterium]
MLTTRRYEYLNFDKIAVHPSVGNHRQLSPSKVSHLEKDILRNGLLEPLVVWERNQGEYFLVGGFHRLEAIKGIRNANPGYFEHVDVRVVSGEPDEIRALNLKLNTDRVDTKITDYFETVIYLNNVNWSTERIAEFLDKSVSWIEDILKYAPMVSNEIHQKLENGEISWNRAREIIDRTLKAPAGKEQDVLFLEISKGRSRVTKPVSFKTVYNHFSRIKSENPDIRYTLHIEELESFVKVLQGRAYDDSDLERLHSIFPELAPDRV